MDTPIDSEDSAVPVFSMEMPVYDGDQSLSSPDVILAAQADARVSATTKLLALGLTQDEIDAMFGTVILS